MIKHTHLAVAIATLFLSAEAVAADDDMHILLKELSKQVAELKSHAIQSDARILELETTLEQEREQNKQLVAARPSPKVATVTIPTNTTVAPESKKEVRPPVTLGDTKGTFKIPGTDTSLGFGGYVKMDVTESSVSAGSNKAGDLYLFIPQIPLSDRGENSQLAFNARESRFWLKSFTPSRWGDINTYLELDLYGSADGYTPRLRHAYGTFGKLLTGQTWTTFVNELALPDTLDINGSVGTATFRQPQVRWTQPFTVAGQSMEFQAAAEMPNSALYTGNWNQASPETLTNGGADRYPDMIVRLNYKPSWGNLSLAGMGRQIRISPTTTPLVANINASQEVWGGAVSLAGKINTFELDNFRFTVNYGNAFGRYSAVDRLEDAAVDAAGNLHQVNIYSAVVAYQHWWDKAWRSTVAYGFEQADQPDFVNQAMTKQAQSAHANLLWSPLSQATLGVEYIYGTRELINGRSGYISRAQLSAKYNF